jgi:beta-glucanase (GH16 family)
LRSVLVEDLSAASKAFRTLTETFPGNLAAFDSSSCESAPDGVTFVLSDEPSSVRRYRSGAISSAERFRYGRFEAEIKPARGDGLVTGFFLHRDSPRQEIDVELLGRDPSCMLVNVYFNPGDEGAGIGYGYRGTPHVVDLGFDASADFHVYAFEWSPRYIRWIVDGRLVHERSSWDPTPIPHLPMHLHANLWSPRSVELAGCLREEVLPARATIKRISVGAL